MHIKFAPCFHHRDMKDLGKHVLRSSYVRFSFGIRCLHGCVMSQRKTLIYSTLYCTVAANCSLNLLPPLVWYSKGLVYPVVLLELSQGYYSLPKGVFMPLLNCGSPSVGLALHWYWATTNYQLITQQKVHRFHWFKVITRQPTDLWGKTLRVVMLWGAQ